MTHDEHACKLDNPGRAGKTRKEMATNPDSPLDVLWTEYARAFQEFDDLTLGRWMAQTLGQLESKAWRLSHPLVGAYRLAAQVAHERQVWLKRLANAPHSYSESPCCRAPFLPLLTRDIIESGLLCQHCNDTLVPFEELPASLINSLRTWAETYAQTHAVAHWDDRQRRTVPDYEKELEAAARSAEGLLTQAGHVLVKELLDFYPAVIWEDQDECLEVRPEDVVMR